MPSEEGYETFSTALGICPGKDSSRPSSYLGEVVDVGVRHWVEGIDSTSEGIDLLVRVSYEDYATCLWQHNIHDGCRKTLEH